jgi:hypothetical protein
VHGHAEKASRKSWLAVLGTEVVAPLADAVGLVDGEEGGPETAEPLGKAGHGQPLRGDVQENEPTGRELALDHRALGGPGCC